MCDKYQFILYTCIDPLSSPAENAADSKASERQRRTTSGSASSSRTYEAARQSQRPLVSFVNLYNLPVQGLPQSSEESHVAEHARQQS